MARLSKPDIASRLGAGERHVCPECSLPYWWQRRLPVPCFVIVMYDGEPVDDPSLFDDIADYDFCCAQCAEEWADRQRRKMSARYDFHVLPGKVT